MTFEETLERLIGFGGTDVGVVVSHDGEVVAVVEGEMEQGVHRRVVEHDDWWFNIARGRGSVVLRRSSFAGADQLRDGVLVVRSNGHEYRFESTPAL